MIAASLINLVVPQVVKRAIDRGMTEGNWSAVVFAASLILVIALVRGIAAFGQRYYGEWLTHRVAFDLRNDFFSAGSAGHHGRGWPVWPAGRCSSGSCYYARCEALGAPGGVIRGGAGPFTGRRQTAG